MLIVSLFSCKKETITPSDPNAATHEDSVRADKFSERIQMDAWKLVDYYSLSPIDYIDTNDVVEQETQLWKYTSGWLKDDRYQFLNDVVYITQNDIKIETTDSATLERKYKIGADKNGVYFEYLTFQYEPLKYKLLELTDKSFTIYTELRKGVVVYTKFNVLQP
jgi:hypothetical protein